MTQQIKEARQQRTHQRLRPILIELFQKTRANTEANQILMLYNNLKYLICKSLKYLYKSYILKIKIFIFNN
jgi:hypothetical protein